MLTRIADHVARALARLAKIFRGKPRFEGLVELATARCQDVEDVLWQVHLNKRIDDAEGIYLDRLGAIVMQARGGDGDPVYRARIKTRIRLNMSSGTAEDVYSVFRMLVNGAPMAVRDEYPAGFSMHVGGTTNGTLAPVYVSFLRAARGVGINGILLWQEHADDEVFTTAVAAALTEATIEESGVVVVDSTAAFPPSGAILVRGSVNDLTDDLLSYSGKTPTSFTGVTVHGTASAGPEFVNDAGALVEAWPLTPAMGFGDEGDPDVGGRFAGAAS